MKKAKFYPNGVSFTANKKALVYCLDEAGPRSTSDTFHDLYAVDVTSELFEQCLKLRSNSMDQLRSAQHWRSESKKVDCWMIGQVLIKQE